MTECFTLERINARAFTCGSVPPADTARSPDNGSTDMPTRKETLASLAKLMEKIDIGMLTTIGPQGHLVSRPLSTQDVEFDGERVWFFTSASSPKVGEIRRNPKVNLAYASKDQNTYISAAGEARVSRDQARIDEYWNDAMKAFFPRGKDDPDLTLIEVALRSVEYWDGPSSWIGKAITFIAARVTGNDDLLAENRIVDVATGRSRKAPAADRTSNKTQARRKAASTLAGAPPARKRTGTAATTPPAKGPATAKAGKRGTQQAAKAATPGRATRTGKAAAKSAKKATKKATKKAAATKRPPARKVAKAGAASSRARGQAEANRRKRQR